MNNEQQPTHPIQPSGEAAGTLATAVVQAAELAPQGKAANLAVIDNSPFANLLDTSRFDHLWRVALVFSRSGFVPVHFQDKPENCFVALQMAFRLQVDPLMLMQGIYIVKGKPGMEAKIAIGLVNSRGPFTGPIQYAYSGQEGGDDRSCVAWAVHKATGQRCEAKVTLAQARAKGWYQSNENWRTLTDLMLAYRSATFLARLYAPETLMGMQTVDEVEEVAARFAPSKVEGTEEGRAATSSATGLRERINAQNQRPPAETPTEEPAPDLLSMPSEPTGERGGGLIDTRDKALAGLFSNDAPLRSHLMETLEIADWDMMSAGTKALTVSMLQRIARVKGTIKTTEDLDTVIARVRTGGSE